MGGDRCRRGMPPRELFQRRAGLLVALVAAHRFFALPPAPLGDRRSSIWGDATASTYPEEVRRPPGNGLPAASSMSQVLTVATSGGQSLLDVVA